MSSRNSRLIRVRDPAVIVLDRFGQEFQVPRMVLIDKMVFDTDVMKELRAIFNGVNPDLNRTKKQSPSATKKTSDLGRLSGTVKKGWGL